MLVEADRVALTLQVADNLEQQARAVSSCDTDYALKRGTYFTGNLLFDCKFQGLSYSTNDGLAIYCTDMGVQVASAQNMQLVYESNSWREWITST